jgi:hypothetical protein
MAPGHRDISFAILIDTQGCFLFQRAMMFPASSPSLDICVGKGFTVRFISRAGAWLRTARRSFVLGRH